MVKVLELANSAYYSATERLIQVSRRAADKYCDVSLHCCMQDAVCYCRLAHGRFVTCHVCAVLQDVEAARQEANENVKFLKPLRKYLEKLNTMDDFVALTDQFKPMLHTMLLIWRHSKCYNCSARFATLLREICNDLIMQVCCS